MGYPTRRRNGAETTIHDVASEAKVSIRTVSRVINSSPKVNQETRERIEAVIARLGFKPSPRARGLATGRSYLIGVVHNDRNALVLDAVQRGVVAEATQRGYELVVHPTPIGGDGSVDDVLDFARRSRVDGLVVLSPVSGVPGIANALLSAKIPAVATSSVPIEGFAAILVSDERTAAAGVARYLSGLGHRHIALINGPSGVSSAFERRAGFLAALAENGLTLAAEMEGDYGFDTGFVAAERLLALDPRPTAIFAANDIMAAAALKAAVARGIHVPSMLSVVGFDGSLIAKMLTPALTTVHRPLGEMARITTRRLLDIIDGQDGPAQLKAELSFVEGGSTAPPPL
jgi:Transcriptional regulators